MPSSSFKSHKSNLITWKTMPLANKAKNYGWADEAIYEDQVVFVLYYDNEKNSIYLLDLVEGCTYNIPNGAKSKGYLVAFKLNNLRVQKGIKKPTTIEINAQSDKDKIKKDDIIDNSSDD